jgi:uncharacterized protein YaeQ
MARGATIYRAQLELSLIDRNIYTERTITVARHPSETLERTLMRILAYSLCFEEDLEFGRGVSATDEPDLWSREGDGRVRHWIEVGQPDGKRLLKATRHSGQTTLFAFGDGVDRWRSAQFDPVDWPTNFCAARIDDGFLANLAAVSDRQLRWSVTLSEGILFLIAGDDSFETSPEVWIGSPLG